MIFAKMKPKGIETRSNLDDYVQIDIMRTLYLTKLLIMLIH